MRPSPGGCPTRRTSPWRRTRPGNGSTLHEALEGYTTGAAYASGEERVKGSLEPGKVADLVILSHDLVRLPLEAWGELHVRGTVWNGRMVHQTPDLPVEMDVRVGS